MPILKKTSAANKPAAAPAEGGKKKSSFGSMWKKASAAPQLGLPLGVHETFFTDYGFMPKSTPESQKETVWLEFRVVADEKLEGRKGRIFYNLVDEDGDSLPGADFFMRDLSILGYGEEIEAMQALDDPSKDDLVEILDAAIEARIWVIVEAKKNKQYVNLNISDVPEQSEKPEFPFGDE